jgi:hypothetical protein
VKGESTCQSDLIKCQLLTISQLKKIVTTKKEDQVDKFNFECKIDNIQLNNLNLSCPFQRLHYRKYAGRKTTFLVEKPVYVSLSKNQSENDC